MAGSGATLTESWLLSRNTIGLDLDPLALRLCSSKTAWIDPDRVHQSGIRVLDTALSLEKSSNPLGRFQEQTDEATREFIDYWFKIETQKQLAALVESVEQESDFRLRRLFEVLVSSTIVTKSGGVSMARDLAHTRPHRVDNKIPRNAIKMFETQLRQAVRAFEEVRVTPKGQSTVLAGDVRQIPLKDHSVDLIVTSPPYANALDYVRAHKFSLAWLGEPIKWLGHTRGTYIGAERLHNQANVKLPDRVGNVVAALADLDERKAKILEQYFKEMTLAIGEMYRVIRPGRAVIMVVGPSTMRGLRIETHYNLALIARRVGFEVTVLASRPIDRDRRMMPARSHNNGQSNIEQRIHEEFVIGLLKP
jgi:hypothetical protein